MNRLSEIKSLVDKEYANVRKSKNNGKSKKIDPNQENIFRNNGKRV